MTGHAKAPTWDDHYYSTREGMRPVFDDGPEIHKPTEDAMTELIEAPPQPGRQLSISEMPHNQQMALATAIATDLVRFIDEQKLSVKIGGGSKRYCMAEGWNFMGQQLGLFARQTQQPKCDSDDAGNERWWAHIEIVDRAGNVVSSAWHQCSRSEKNWADRDSFALASMATTRATGKAFRQNWSWVMRMNGFEPTPAEEMPLEAAKPQTIGAAAQKILDTIQGCVERSDLNGLNEVSGLLRDRMATFNGVEKEAIRQAGTEARANLEAEKRAEELLTPETTQ